MFVVHHKGVQRTGDHPTLLYGYGGTCHACVWTYDLRMRPSVAVHSVTAIPKTSLWPRARCYTGFNISLEPGFSVARLCFILAYGGVVAVANLRYCAGRATRKRC
jgi:prolyl oligopeptidase PreP (S9A serine peptidase family)